MRNHSRKPCGRLSRNPYKLEAPLRDSNMRSPSIRSLALIQGLKEVPCFRSIFGGLHAISRPGIVRYLNLRSSDQEMKGRFGFGPSCDSAIYKRYCQVEVYIFLAHPCVYTRRAQFLCAVTRSLQVISPPEAQGQFALGMVEG